MEERRYTNGEITVVWRPERCIHAGICWRTLPEVYRPKERPWVRPQFAVTEELIAQIDRCPSRALTYERNE